MYNESAFWGLAFLAALFCVATGACVGSGKFRAALACLLVTAAFTVEAVNSHIGFKVHVQNAALHTVHSTALAQRTTPTASFHVAFWILLVVAALLRPFGGQKH